MKLEFVIKTRGRNDMIDITGQVSEKLAESGIISGICTVFIPHTTAGVTINEGADPDVQRDIIMELDKRFPWDDGYHHSEGNSSAHIKTSLVGPSITAIVENGRLMLGTWQRIFLCEYDGPRNRKVWIKILGGE